MPVYREQTKTTDTTNKLQNKVNVFIKSLDFNKNAIEGRETKGKLFITNMNVYIYEPVNFYKNHAGLSTIQFQLCDILFSGKINFDSNHCNEVVLLDTYIKVMEQVNITFINNRYFNRLITVESAEQYMYNQLYPFCLFHYVAVNYNKVNLPAHFVISFNNNNNVFEDIHMMPTQNNGCTMSFCHFTSHCKWIPSAAFYDYSPEFINKQIIQNDDLNCIYHKHIC